MKRLLVTEGAGFIGSALVRYILGATSDQVLVVDKLTYASNLDSLASVAGHPRYRFAHADISDGPAIAHLLTTFRPNAILHLSTDEVYGSLPDDGSLFTESTPYAPNSPYSASKAASDHLVRTWMRTYGLPVLVTHCSNNYGPYLFLEKLIPLMIINALAGKPLPVYGDNSQIRD